MFYSNSVNVTVYKIMHVKGESLLKYCQSNVTSLQKRKMEFHVSKILKREW